MSQQTITDFDIQALVDNELSWEQEKSIRALLERDAEAKRRYEELCRQKRLLQEWWARGGFSH